MAEITNYFKLNYNAKDINDRLEKAGNAVLKTEVDWKGEFDKTNGTKIGTLTIGETKNEIYAPTSSGTGSGDMLKATYDADGDGIVDKAAKDGNGNVIADTYATITYIDNLLYKPIEITRFYASPSLFEKGETVTSLTFSWSTSKTPKSIQLDGETVTGTSTSLTGLSITTDKTFTLSVTDEKNTITKNASVSFGNKIYYGDVSYTINTSSLIKTLGMSGLVPGDSSNPKTFTVPYDVTTGENVVFAYPKAFGKATFTIDNNIYDLGSPADVEYYFDDENTDTSHHEPYYVYSANLGTGHIDLKITCRKEN